ncbi:MAG: hypothetical protein IPI11_13565 [Haliscomenobacter sp.]|nr:hypothetical protein [Haliscomenobacter sp.]
MIPWSYDRLAFQSGHGAGVISPAWYALLFQRRDALAARWMVQAARLLRQERLETSPAQVQEAVRLVETLAALRQKMFLDLKNWKTPASACCVMDKRCLWPLSANGWSSA